MKIKPLLFALPYIWNGEKIDGSILPWPERCRKCLTLSCTKAVQSDDPSICSYGYNYKRINKEVVVGGFILREYGQLTPARKKLLRVNGKMAISIRHLTNAVQAADMLKQHIEQEVEDEKQRVIEDYKQSKQYEPDFLAPLRQEITRGLSFVHDYKQINTQISHNINVILEMNREGDSIEDKVSNASEPEKAIYHASKLLEEKLNVARFLMDPEWMRDTSIYTASRFHGAVLKYRRIYTAFFATKDIDVRLIGHSIQDIIANPQALGVIAHTFIDNAFKYSPKGGVIEIRVDDADNYIYYGVSSYGPRILPEENNLIFEAFYRGEVAKRQEEEGAGYGLYVSQLIAQQHLNTEIKVEQERQQKPKYGHWTTFSVTLPLRARGAD